MIRKVTGAFAHPVRRGDWFCTLECGHWVPVKSKTKPTQGDCKQCDLSDKSKAKGDSK